MIALVSCRTGDELRRLLERHANTPLLVRLRPQLLGNLDPETLAGIREAAWEPVVAGWTDPILAMLPPSYQDLQLNKEIQTLRRAGLNPEVGLVLEGWEPSLIRVMLEHGIGRVVVGGNGKSPGRVDYLSSTVPFFPVAGTVGVEELDRLLDGGEELTTTATFDQELPWRDVAPDRRWRQRLEDAPLSGLLYRKMLWIAGRLERPSPTQTERMLEAQARDAYLGDPEPAFRALLEVSQGLSRHVGAGPVDFDADTVDELAIRTAELEMMLDPAQASILFLDHVGLRWPVSLVSGEGSWRLTEQAPLSILAIEESRSAVRVDLMGPTLALELTASEQSLFLTYRPQEVPADRTGPELSLGLAPEAARLRVDGGGWMEIGDPVAHDGHRFRFSDGERTVLLELVQPGTVFARRVAGGVMTWPNWLMAGGQYRVNVTMGPA
jgi:hypothetical protein